MFGPILDTLQQIFFWPGDTILAWLLTHHPQLAMWLDMHPTSYGGLYSGLISVLVGWGLFSGLCQLLLLIVQLQETRGTRR